MAESAGDIFGPINAETNDTSQFTSTVVEAGNALTADAAAKNYGSYGFKMAFTGANDECYGVKTFGEVTAMYARVYVYIPSTLVITTRYQYFSFFAIVDNTTTLLFFGMQRRTADPATAAYNWYFSGQGITAAWSTTGLALDQWILVEAYWKAGTGANDGGTVWIAGDYVTPVFNDIDNDASAYAADRIWVGNVQAGSLPPNGDYYYMDDIKGNSTQIGAYSEAGGVTVIPQMMAYYRRLRS